jgi:death-on-curing protein
VIQYLELEVFALELVASGFNVKDYGLLGAALARPRTTVFGEDAYKTLELKASALVQSLIKSHPMLDGNKSVAWLALNAFLFLNNRVLVAKESDAIGLITGIANDKYSVDEIAAWIKLRM